MQTTKWEMGYSPAMVRAIKYLKSARKRLSEEVDIDQLKKEPMQSKQLDLIGGVLDQLDEVYTQLLEVRDGSRNFISSDWEGEKGGLHSNSGSEGRKDNSRCPDS